MYERFTDRARKVMQLANQEAMRFSHQYIGTEHILMGLVKEGSGVAANVLNSLNIDVREIRLEVEKIVQSGPNAEAYGKLPQTPRAKKVIEYSIEEARNLNHDYVGTEHLLLGLLRDQEGVAAQVLTNLGLTLEDVREEVRRVLESNHSTERSSLPALEEAKAQPVPPELQADVLVEQMNRLIEALRSEKEWSVARQDFERAASARDHAILMQKSLHRIIEVLKWKCHDWR
jgi:ATP-dependent Clp protease ATP-binding subunit ClpC